MEIEIDSRQQTFTFLVFKFSFLISIEGGGRKVGENKLLTSKKNRYLHSTFQRPLRIYNFTCFLPILSIHIFVFCFAFFLCLISCCWNLIQYSINIITNCLVIELFKICKYKDLGCIILQTF